MKSYMQFYLGTNILAICYNAKIKAHNVFSIIRFMLILSIVHVSKSIDE